MNIDAFMQWLADVVASGQDHLSRTLRALTYRADPELFEVLDETDGAVFLEPLLFAHFAVKQPRISLPQIVLGYVDPSLYPDAMEVQSDAAGTIYLPRIGYFLTEARDRTLVLRWDPDPSHAALLDGDAPVAFRFEEVPRIPGTSIELGRHGSPLLADLAAESSPHGADFRVVDERSHGWADHLARALELIRTHWPAYHRQIEATVRQVVLFQSDTLNSFATLSAHGVAFLNVRAHDDEVFFVDDLLHQCGHVMFNAATGRRTDYVAVDLEAPIGAFNGHRDDDRPVYIVLHGAFTEFAMVHGLRLCDERGVFSGRKAHELAGRLAFIAQKAAIDLRNLADESLLTPAGRALYETFRAAFERLRRDRPELLSSYRMAGQPYNFSYELFARANPMPAV